MRPWARLLPFVRVPATCGPVYAMPGTPPRARGSMHARAVTPSARAARLGLLLAYATSGGCVGSQHALDPAGIQAQRLAGIWWIYFAATLAVYVIVMVVFFTGVVKRVEHQPQPAPPEPLSPEGDRGRLRMVSIAVVISAVLLLGLLAADVITRHGVQHLDHHETLAVKVTGHQWWWEFEYEDTLPANRAVTANELHLPLGRVVRLDLQSNDVIHSFWAPNLHGKRDLIPGHPTSLVLRADRPGRYHGQCAEYCGMQHATMRFDVVVEPEPNFDAWLAVQRAPARDPVTPAERHGRDVFLGTMCMMCHSIHGTPARGHQGPDLTHVGSRRMIASGTLLNTTGALAGWIADPQHVRPGVYMPPNRLAGPDLHALVAYLQSLR